MPEEEPVPCPLTLIFFGPPQVRVRGQNLPRLHSRKTLWLLALLTLRHGQALERDWLAGTLWPESSQTEAFANLRNTLHDLRRALGGEGCRLTSPTKHTLRLDLAGAEVDVVEFDAAIASEKVEAQIRAVELVRGPLLEGCLEEWALQERIVREQAYFNALHRLATEALSRGEPALAVERLKCLLSHDELREGALQTLLEALAACGDYAELTHAYRNFRVRLFEELHCEPSTETTQLYHRLRERARHHLSEGSKRTETLPSVLQPEENSAPMPHTAPDTQSPKPDADLPNIMTPNALLDTVAPPAHRGRRIVGIRIVSVLAAGLLLFMKFGLRTNPVVSAKTVTSGASTAASDSDPKSIAVLPFVCLSADKSDEHLSDGMTEELINALAKVKGLRVPGRSSSLAFKDKVGEDIFHKVGEQLHVKTVLEGSVQRTGNKLRITARLINVTDGYHIWSESYDRELKDILAVQSEIAARVAKSLNERLSADEAQSLAKRPTESSEAHRLYLLGRYHFLKNTPTGFKEAARCYREALRLDPNYALAYCGLADNYAWMGSYVMVSREAWAREKEMAEKALALDPNLAEAHLSLGLALVLVFDWQGGEREIKRALELNPNPSLEAFARDQYGAMLCDFGRFEEGLKEIKMALELDPLSPQINDDYVLDLLLARRYDEAIAHAQTTQALFPDDVVVHHWSGRCYLGKGDATGAIREIQRGRALSRQPFLEADLGYAYGILGDRAKAEKVLHRLSDQAKHRFVSPVFYSIVYMGLGERKSSGLLDRCYTEQDGNCQWFKEDPIFDSVRQEPRFQALLKKVGLNP